MAQTIISRKVECAADFEEASALYRAYPNLYRQTNCYSYGLGIPELGYAVPGCLTSHGSPLYYNENYPSFLKRKFGQDQLIEVDEAELNAPDTQIIALVIKEYLCGHIFKYHLDGTWSHQIQSGDMITNLDTNGEIITDLNKAQLGFCDQLVCYYKVPPEGVRFLPRIELSA